MKVGQGLRTLDEGTFALVILDGAQLVLCCPTSWVLNGFSKLSEYSVAARVVWEISRREESIQSSARRWRVFGDGRRGTSRRG